MSRFLPFVQARAYIRSLKLRGVSEWRKYCKFGWKPTNIPSNPDKKYKGQGWILFDDWLGMARTATQNLTFRSFEDARTFVRALKLKNRIEWNMYCKLGKKPTDIPHKPERTYRNQGWISYGDWLGYEEFMWSLSKVKELTRALKQSGMFFEWKWIEEGPHTGHFEYTSPRYSRIT
jgi:hypothetical protein